MTATTTPRPSLLHRLLSDRGESAIMQQITLFTSLLTTGALIGTIGVLTRAGIGFQQQAFAQMESDIAAASLYRDFDLADGIEVEDSTQFTLIDRDYRSPDAEPGSERECRRSTWSLTPSPEDDERLQLVNSVETLPGCDGGWLPTTTSERVVISSVEAGARFTYENVAGRPITFTDGAARTPSSLQRFFILTFGGYDRWWTDDEIIDPTIRVVRMSMTALSPMTSGVDASIVGAVPVALETIEHPTGNDDVVYTTTYQILTELP